MKAKKGKKTKDTTIDADALNWVFDEALNPENSDASHGETVLWLKVIWQALFDFCTPQQSAIEEQYQAERWLLRGGVAHCYDGFYYVCVFAGINPGWLRAMVQACVDNPEKMEELRARICR